jgi:hypothetical protein
MERCGHCADAEPCDHINGTCPGSCDPGYHGERCDIGVFYFLTKSHFKKSLNICL